MNQGRSSVVAKRNRYWKRASRMVVSVAMDSTCWFFGIFGAALLRQDFSIPDVQWMKMLGLWVSATLLQLVVGYVMPMYRRRFVKGTFEEIHWMTLSMILVGLMLWVPTLVLHAADVPRSLMLIALPIALVFGLAERFTIRVLVERAAHPGAEAKRAIIVGAGYMGTKLVHWMSSDRLSTLVPVGLVDDDIAKQNMVIRNVRVLGSIDDIARAAEETAASVVVVAIRDASPELLRKVQDIARPLNLNVKVLPPIAEAVEKGLAKTDLRDLRIEDLLGRPVVNTNVGEIAGYLSNKRVLVTGAGGSIGSQLCVEIKKFGPSELIMLDRDETGLQSVQIGTDGNGLLTSNDVVLADIRDAERLKELFLERRPDVVFHAAALKHLPMLEQYPSEAWKTNVLGTLNVLEAARAANVTTFVNISTDKAANPTSVLGYSKRYAEQLTAAVGAKSHMRAISVRFGNVIGSRGSMLPTFTRLIREGRKLTVTHPDATRFFMTIPEACQLVLQAGGIGDTGEVLILDMGEPVRILDVAQRMIAISEKNIEIVYTGLREGEKLHEELIGSDERADRPRHPLISQADVPAFDPDRLSFERWEAMISSRHLAKAS